MSRTHIDYRSTQESAYRDFKLQHPDIKISFKKWKEIVYAFNDDFRNYILETGDRERLPYGFGEFSIIKKKRKQIVVDPLGVSHNNLPVDWKRTMEKGRRIFLMNYDTEGYFFGWKWFKDTARFKGRAYWYFKPTRLSSRMLAHYIKADKNNQHIYKEWN